MAMSCRPGPGRQALKFNAGTGTTGPGPGAITTARWILDPASTPTCPCRTEQQRSKLSVAESPKLRAKLSAPGADCLLLHGAGRSRPGGRCCDPSRSP